MLKNYKTSFDEIKEEIFFLTKDNAFRIGKDLTRIKFKTSDYLPFNKKIHVSVCVITISSVSEDNGIYYPRIILHDCFYDNEESDDDHDKYIYLSCFLFLFYILI